MQRHPKFAGRRHVRFYERAGPDARATLEALALELHDGGGEVELLASAEEAGLWLLVARGGPEVTTDEATRTWRFRTVDR